MPDWPNGRQIPIKNSDTPSPASPHYPQNLWLLQSGSLNRLDVDAGTILEQRATKNADALALQPSDGTLWYADNNGIQSVDLDGKPLLDAPIALPGDEKATGLAVDDARGMLWVANSSGVHQLSVTGQPMSFVPLEEIASSPVLMRDRGEAWVLAAKQLYRVADGAAAGIDLPGMKHADALAGMQDGGGAWVADGKSVVGLRSAGNVVAGPWRHGVSDAVHLAGDGEGGVWIASRQEIVHIDHAGRNVLHVRPVKDGLLARGNGGAIQALAADRRNGDAWFAVNHSAHRLSSAGVVTGSVELAKRGGAVMAGALHIDDTSPEIWITRPDPEIYTNDNTPPLSVAYTDYGSRVVVGTLGFSLNDQAITVSCERTPTDADCVPTMPFEDGYHTLSTTIEDLAHNVSAPDSLRFTVDTIPPTITVRSPVANLYTNQPLLEIEGELDEFAYLHMNDESLPIDANFAFATERLLAEGDNRFHFRAEDRATNASELTRNTVLDTQPPTLVLESPADGLATAERVVTVSGHVDEIATVTVAGERVAVDSEGRFSFEQALTEGLNALAVVAEDRAGNRVSAVRSVNYDIAPPPMPDLSLISLSEVDAEGYVTISGLPGTGEPGGYVEIVVYETEAGVQTFELGTQALPDGARIYRITVAEDGSFNGRVYVGVDGDPRLDFRLIDGAGNAGETVVTNTRELLDHTGTIVGAVKGEFSVDPTGAANFRIPIPVPAGAGGMQPDLALLYSSRAGDGHLGVGWSLSGLSAVSRCGKTIAQDGVSIGVVYNGADRFCLDGQRLMLNDKNATYGASGTGYHTEIASFQDVTAHGGSVKNGPAYFRVRDKSGLIRYYGDANVGPDARIEMEESSTARLWAVSRIEDRFGNYIEFTYNASTTAGREYWPERIRWYNQDGTRLGEVEFGYTTDRHEKSRGYLPGGTRTQLTRLMNKIEVSVLQTQEAGGGWQSVGEYNLEYKTASGTGRTRLEGIEYCTGAGECLPKTLLRYQGERWSFASSQNRLGYVDESVARFIDLDKDGRVDSMYRSSGNLFVNVNGITRNTGIELDKDVDGQYTFIDANQDGYLDVIIPSHKGLASWRIYPWLESQNNFSRTPYATFTSNAGEPEDVPLVVDTDGDGRQEIIIKATSPYASGASLNILRFDEDDRLIKHYTGFGILRKQKVHVLEYNGDGRPDLMVERNDCSAASAQAVPIPPDDGGGGGGGGGTTNPAPQTTCGETAGVLINIGGNYIDPVLGDPLAGWEPGTGGGGGHIPPDDGGWCDRDTGICYHPQFVPEFQALIDCDPRIQPQILPDDPCDGGGWPPGGGDGGGDPNPEYGDTWIVSDARPADVNGDGLTDIVYYNDSDNAWRLVLNTGDGWQQVWRGFSAELSDNEFNQSQLADINTDGYPDLVVIDGEKANVLFGTGSGFANDGGTVPYDKHGWMLQDVDTDGIIDVVHKDTVWEVRYGNGASPDLLEEITDGYGEQTRVLYGALGTHVVNGEKIYLGHLASGDRDVGPDDKQVDFMAPLQVVAAFAVDTGTPSMIFTHYRYGGARVETTGRGFVGFREVHATNENTGIRTLNIHRQAFPYVGMVAESTQEIPPKPVTPTTPRDLDDVFDGPCAVKPWMCNDTTIPLRVSASVFAASADDGKLISRTTSTQAKRDYSASSSYQARGLFPYVKQTVTKSYDFNSGALVKIETIDNAYADFGNASKVTVKVTDASGADAHVITTSNTYGDSVAKWCLGRLTQSTVKHEWQGQVATRRSSFSYDMGGECQLTSETLEPGDVAELVTSYQHDRFGNVTHRTVTGHDGENVSSRGTTAVFESTGRFAKTVTNALGHSETQHWDARYGAKTQTTGPNGLTTSWTYDGLGRVTQTVAPSGARSVTDHAWCEKAGCESESATYRVIQTNPDGTVQFSFFDRLQRELGGWTTDMGGRRLGVDKVYDLRGRLIAESLPAFHGSDKRCWAYIEYDNLNREIARYAPASQNACDASRDSGLPGLVAVQAVYASPPSNYHVTRTVYSKLTTYIQAANGRVQSRTAYPNGWLREIAERGVTGAISHVNLPAKAKQDGAILHTLYAYDAQGNTATVTDALDNTVGMDYDVRGRKTSMNDPNMGHWGYQYNAFGELVSQTDAKNQTVTMRYDALGRMVQRTEPEGLTSWTYDIAEGAGIGKLASVSGPGGYFEAHAYDSLGRRTHSVHQVDKEAWWASWNYDKLGRVTAVNYPALLAQNIDDDDAPVANLPEQAVGLRVQYHYDHGRLKSVTDGNGSVLWQIGDLSGAGRVSNVALGNTLTERFVFDLARGTLEQNQVQTASGSARFDIRYDWDAVGNLVKRDDRIQNVAESFTYDSLDRLLTSSVTLTGSDVVKGALDETHAYNAIGNITQKGASTDNYVYGDGEGNLPHAVQQARVRGATQSYEYDANGNIKSSAGRDVEWTSYNKPSRIERGDVYSAFEYGPDRSRYRHTAYDGKELAVTTYIGGIYERITGGADTLHRYNIRAGNQVIAVKEVTTKSVVDATVLKHALNYLHRDHLGSVRLVTDSAGKVVDRLDYDAWGQRRNYALLSTEESGINASDALLGLDYVPAWKQFHRGFTGHEMLDHLGLIHMNGRIYDATVGRFLSADPFVQFPESTQGFNRYTYVGNNPLSHSDPSGYFSLKKALGKVLGAIAPLLSLIPVCAGGWCSAIASGLSGYLLTGSLSVGLKMGALAFAGAKLAGAIGDHFGNPGFADFGKLLAKSIVHGVTMGGLSKAGGGRFGDGFLGAFVSSMAAPAVDAIGGVEVGDKALRITTAAVIGGTASKLGGGNFANGAITAAFVQAFNGEKHRTDAGMEKGDFASLSDEQRQALWDEFKESYDDIVAGWDENNKRRINMNPGKPTRDPRTIMWRLARKFGAYLAGKHNWQSEAFVYEVGVDAAKAYESFGAYGNARPSKFGEWSLVKFQTYDFGQSPQMIVDFYYWTNGMGNRRPATCVLQGSC